MNFTRRKLAYAGGLMAGAALIGATSAVPAFACADDDLAKAVEDFRKAMVEGNGARLLELSADEMSFGHANGVVQTKIEFVKSVVASTFRITRTASRATSAWHATRSTQISSSRARTSL
jgi:hypothetical protein